MHEIFTKRSKASDSFIFFCNHILPRLSLFPVPHSDTFWSFLCQHLAIWARFCLLLRCVTLLDFCWTPFKWVASETFTQERPLLIPLGSARSFLDFVCTVICQQHFSKILGTGNRRKIYLPLSALPQGIWAVNSNCFAITFFPTSSSF